MSLLLEGARAAEEILQHVFRISVDKAIDPLSPSGFLTIQHRLAQALSGAASDAMGPAMRSAINQLDVDWKTLPEAGRDEVIRAARETIKASVGPSVLPAIRDTLSVSGKTMIKGAKASMNKRYKLDVSVSLDAVDARIVKHAVASQAHYVRDALGRRVDAYGSKARDIVSSGLENGLGRYEIAKELGTALQVAGRADSYWQLIAGVYANRSRTFGQLRTMTEAGIDTYVFNAVMDMLTSDVCRFMNGKRFTVKHALDRYMDAAAGGPEGVVEAQPWVQNGKDDKGGDILYFKQGGQRVTVATIDKSAVGQIDQAGSFSNSMSNSSLEKAGATVPPIHGHCRSLIMLEGSTDDRTSTVSVPEQLEAPVVPDRSLQQQRMLAVDRVQRAGNAFADAQAAFNNGEPLASLNRDARVAVRGAISALEPEMYSYDLDTLKNNKSLAEKAMGNHYDYDNGTGGTAYHGWGGAVSLPEPPGAYARSLKMVGEGRLPGSSEVGDLNLLIHEEVHGHSPISATSGVTDWLEGKAKHGYGKLAYNGYGASIEEATTEVIARNLTRRVLQKQMEEYPGHAAWRGLELPEVERNAWSASGAYGEQIAKIISHYGEVTGDFANAGKEVEAAMLRSRRGKHEVSERHDLLTLFLDSTDLRENQKGDLEERLMKDSTLANPSWLKHKH